MERRLRKYWEGEYSGGCLHCDATWVKLIIVQTNRKDDVWAVDSVEESEDPLCADCLDNLPFDLHRSVNTECSCGMKYWDDAPLADWIEDVL